jgi:hypothetical protein
VLNAARALSMSSASAPELPRVEGLRPLYEWGCKPRKGEVVMIAGRSGMQKSGFALWWVSQMNVPTLYFSADMTMFQASVRLACSQLGMTTEEVEATLAAGGDRAKQIMETLEQLNMTLVPGAITFPKIDASLGAYLEQSNRYPELIVIDNLMDMSGGASDYTEQMNNMQELHELSRATEATLVILHHATDKGWSAQSNPYAPPARSEIKGGMSEKPELVLTVALEPETHFFRIGVVKQRMGRQDATAQNPVVMRAWPEYTQFGPVPADMFIPST